MSLRVQSVPTENTVISSCTDCSCDIIPEDLESLTASPDGFELRSEASWPADIESQLQSIVAKLDAIGHDEEVLGTLKLLPCKPEKPARFQGGVLYTNPPSVYDSSASAQQIATASI